MDDNYSKLSDQELSDTWDTLYSELREVEREFFSFDYWQDAEYTSRELNMNALRRELQAIQAEQRRRDT